MTNEPADTPQGGTSPADDVTPDDVTAAPAPTETAASDDAPSGYPPPPQAGGYASQFGLVRPLQGRYIAGVCAALGRATNTDPVLWRVALPVLTLLGGLGGLLYIIGWLLIPAEGDTGSPLEALAGRGHSSTSRPTTIALTVVAVLTMFGGLTHVSGGLFVIAAVVAGVVLLATRRADMPTAPAATGWPDAPMWTGSAPARPDIPTAPVDGDAVDAPSYQPPFAPYGPFSATAYPTTQFPGMAPTSAPPPVVPPVVRRRSPARRLIISAVALVIGVLAILDTTNAWSIPAGGYFAAALGTIGLGLVIGSFVGRTRGPITLGVLLTICLLISIAVDHNRTDFHNKNVTLAPASIAALDDSYHQDVGQFTLDLSHLNFAGADRSIDIRLNVGQITVILPPDVDVSVTAKAGVGSTHAFGSGRDGINQRALSVTDDGADGPGGGTLHINAHVTAGQVEINR